MPEPSPSGPNGRGKRGQFGPGNSFSRGNPFAKRVAQIRSALMRSIKPADIRLAVKALVERAKAGDRFALAELLDRSVGRPASSVEAEIMERLKALEESVAQKQNNRSAHRIEAA